MSGSHPFAMPAADAADDARVRFTIGPLSMAIELAALEAWLAGSVRGDRIVYARGPDLPRSTAAVKRVTALIEARRVIALRERKPGGWDFIAERRADPVEAVPPPVAGGLNDVLRLLRRRINLGQPCPTNAEIAAECNLRNADAASYLFKKLVRAGEIISTDHGPRMRRVVRIAGGAKSTPEGPL